LTENVMLYLDGACVAILLCSVLFVASLQKCVSDHMLSKFY